MLGFARDEIEGVYITLLADAVNTPQTLLQARRVPGKVVVNHQPTELEVDAFASGLSRDGDLARRAEVLLRALPFVRIHAAMDLAG